MNAVSKNLLLITSASLLSSISVLSLLVIGVNRKRILGTEWDNDGPASFGFAGQFIMPFMLLSMLLMSYALLLWMLRWHIWPNAMVRFGVFLIIMLPAISFWGSQQEWMRNQVLFK
ncbi:hypothetical protein [Hymenobacter sp. B1770]|uniref:hypothetical protein n=1 Tax=Hymenobacter sp. B1770 TaxID=1718788 RepID=UPI003CF0F6FD